jgi:hypothetical protein
MIPWSSACVFGNAVLYQSVLLLDWLPFPAFLRARHYKSLWDIQNILCGHQSFSDRTAHLFDENNFSISLQHLKRVSSSSGQDQYLQG